MGDITRNLSRWEFACKCGCGLSEPHPLLVCSIQDVIDTAGVETAIITSGSRCEIHHQYLLNKGESAELSKHRIWMPSNYSLAADVVFRGADLALVVNTARVHPVFTEGGLGLYLGKANRLHMDVRGTKARWGSVDGKQVSFQDALSELHRRKKP
jgi:hypothetical protein